MGNDATRTVWKYPVEVGPNSLRIPRGARFLRLGWETPYDIQGRLVTWAEVDPDQPYERAQVEVVGTGFTVHAQWEYIDTVQVGSYVWHLYTVPT